MILIFKRIYDIILYSLLYIISWSVHNVWTVDRRRKKFVAGMGRLVLTVSCLLNVLNAIRYKCHASSLVRAGLVWHFNFFVVVHTHCMSI